MPECVECGEPIDDQNSECPACGTPRAGGTEEFGPVAATEAATVAGEFANEGPVLIVRKGPSPGERFYLESEMVTVGRDPDRDVFLNDMTVSRSHAIFEQRDGVVTVRDEGSLNGTYVNGVSCDSAVLNDGDVVQIGTFQMVFFVGKGASR